MNIRAPIVKVNNAKISVFCEQNVLMQQMTGIECCSQSDTTDFVIQLTGSKTNF